MDNKSCPFCGGVADYYGPERNIENPRYQFIECRSCFARIERENDDDVRPLWNKRVGK